MANPYLAELRLFSFSHAPKGWALCNGQLLLIQQNQALFALLGTTYGGNGQTNFALPNLQGRTPIHMGNGHIQGESGGQNSHTLSISELPTHTHVLNGTNGSGTQAVPTGTVLSRSATQLYAPPNANLGAMNAASVTSVGGSQPHENRQPLLVLNWCIALQGIFPDFN